METEGGRLQVLPFAWDARAKVDGGQRWYHNYSDEEIRPEDRVHWRQPLQGWNGMCADCHSDGLIRRLQPVKIIALPLSSIISMLAVYLVMAICLSMQKKV